MKKIIVILFLFIYSTNSIAHIGHYIKYNKIEMEIFRNGELIGYNHYFFKKNGAETIVTNQIKFVVKLLGATVFQVEGYSEEKYFKDQLVSYNSKTIQNKRPNLHFLSLRQTFSCLLFSQHSVVIAEPYLSINRSHVSPTDKSTIEGNINATNIIITNAMPKPSLFSSISRPFSFISLKI